MSPTLSCVYTIIALLCPALVYIALRSQPSSIRWVSAAAVFLLSVFVMAYSLHRQGKKLKRIILEDCDPERFIRICRKSVEHPFVSQDSRSVNVSRLLLSMGFKEAGRFEEAVGMLNNVVPFPKNFRGRQLAYTRASLKMELLLLYKDIEAAREERANIEILLKEIERLNPRRGAMLREADNDLDIALRIAEGNDEGAEEFYTEAFKNAKFAIERVGMKYNLGVFYIRKSETAKALDAFKYVAENGNKLFIAKESKRIIGELTES